MTPAKTAQARLFVALWPPPAARRALAAEQARWTWPSGAALVAPHALHLTLHFIGAVPQADVARIADSLHMATAPFALVFDRAALWPRGVAVLEASRTPDALLGLHLRLVDRLRALRLPVEARALRAHVTLARKAGGAQAAGLDDAPVVWRTRGGYALVQSCGAPCGYRTLRRYA